MKQQKPGESAWRAIAMLGGIGVDLGVCMGAGYWVGNWISQRQGGEPLWIVGGMMTGFILGIVSIVLIIRKYIQGGPNG